MQETTQRPGVTIRQRCWGERLLLAHVVFLVAVPSCSKRREATSRIAPHEALVRKLEALAWRKDAESVRRACREPASSCQCVQVAAETALGRDLGQDALEQLDRAPPGCALRGLLAEALARSSRFSEAERESKRVLQADPQDPHATYAIAHAHLLRGKPEDARREGQRALSLGRGRPALLLLGLLAYREGRLPEALGFFEKMLALDPKDFEAHYNLGAVYHRLDRYRLARESYLAALKLQPRFADARYNMVLLTHQAGASEEAKHHLRKFAAAFPKDPRLARLQAALASRPARAVSPPARSAIVHMPSMEADLPPSSGRVTAPPREVQSRPVLPRTTP